MVGDPALIRRFPHQTWNASLRFDQETGGHAACLWGVRSLFLTSLTRGAATTDGVHPLTDTALAEALVLLRAMELVADGDTSLLLQNSTTKREKRAGASEHGASVPRKTNWSALFYQGLGQIR